MERHLEVAGAVNVRDLGGLPTVAGGHTRFGVLVRSASLRGLDESGWGTLLDHGVRTVIDLRNDGEEPPDVGRRPSEITTVALPLDGIEDREFWDRWESGPQWGTPLYYRPHLERFPQRTAAVLSAIARARQGAVLFHCVGGRDRTGQIAMIALALAGVLPSAIAADYMLSDERLRPYWAARGEDDPTIEIAAYLSARGTSAGALIERLSSELDIEAAMLGAGLTRSDLRALRARLLAAETQ